MVIFMHEKGGEREHWLQKTSLSHCLTLCLSGMLGDYPPMEGKEILRQEDKNFVYVCVCVCANTQTHKSRTFCTAGPGNTTLNMLVYMNL